MRQISLNNDYNAHLIGWKQGKFSPRNLRNIRITLLKETEESDGFAVDQQAEVVE